MDPERIQFMARTLAIGLVLVGGVVAVSAEPPNERQLRIDEVMERAKMEREQLILIHEMRIAGEMRQADLQRQVIQFHLSRFGLNFERDGNAPATRKRLD